MAEERQRGRIKSLLSRLFGSDYGTEEETSIVRPSASNASTEEGSPPDELLSHEGLSATVLTIAERIAVLKKSFEFEADSKSRLEGIDSTRDLLLFLNVDVLSRFSKLHEIGLINSESFKVLNSLNEKLEVAAARHLTSGGDQENIDVEELRKENLELKQRIENLHAKYVKTGIVTETELSQEKEIAYLQSRVREQHSYLTIAKKRLKVLASYQEMIQSLRAKNSLLNSKLENQSRLLRTLTATAPKQQELVSTVENLADENQRLKSELERQAVLFQQLKTHLPADAQQTAADLIKRNEGLHTHLEQKEAQLESVASSRPSGGDLLDDVEKLSEKNAHLKSSIDTTQLIEQYIEDRKNDRGDPDKIIEALKMENQRLELALSTKEEQLKISAADPASRQLMKAYTRLQNEYRELYNENKSKAQLYQEELNEKQALMAQVREKTALIRENQQLRAELESRKGLIGVIKKLESQCQAVKKERSEISSKYDRAMVELDGVNKKLAKITAEYSLLMKEYEGIFNTR